MHDSHPGVKGNQAVSGLAELRNRSIVQFRHFGSLTGLGVPVRPSSVASRGNSALSIGPAITFEACGGQKLFSAKRSMLSRPGVPGDTTCRQCNRLIGLAQRS